MDGLVGIEDLGHEHRANAHLGEDARCERAEVTIMVQHALVDDGQELAWIAAHQLAPARGLSAATLRRHLRQNVGGIVS